MPARLTYRYLTNEDLPETEGSISAATENPVWTNLPPVRACLSLRQLTESSVRITLRDMMSGGTEMGHFDLILAEHMTTNVKHAVEFRRNVYADPRYDMPFTALATGVGGFQ